MYHVAYWLTFGGAVTILTWEMNPHHYPLLSLTLE